MTLYDPDNPQHLEYLRQARARWTPEKEAALQADFRRRGIGRHAAANHQEETNA